ncbi:putative GroES-like superfamily protein [Helianthus annuus]|uniref:GroES-like superfamily protein n=1 Tax=Helianthus annuus TaxID=4232 RepID=A0A9K3IP65_HELAN|nr:putative GroES-like superfamily protein [Helianthus annuus]
MLSRNSSPNHRFRGDELLSCLKGITPHSHWTEAAGVVTAVGTGVCDLKIGDVVYHHFGSQVAFTVRKCFVIFFDAFVKYVMETIVCSNLKL